MSGVARHEPVREAYLSNYWVTYLNIYISALSRFFGGVPEEAAGAS